MNASKALKRLLVAAVSLVGVVGLFGSLTNDNAGQATPSGGAVGSYEHQDLQPSADMTQWMSVPTADGPMQRGVLIDDQFRRSVQDPGFVLALEEHHADIDRMLARRSD